MNRHILNTLRVLSVIALVATASLTIHPRVYSAAEESWAVPSVTSVANTILETVKGAVQREGSDTLSQIVSIITLAAQIIGISDDSNHPFGYNKSVVASLSSGIALVYGNPPASTYAFAVDMGKTLGFLPRTYAQGFGFTNLGPLLEIWKVFRNIAYGIIAVILIVVGFMVMFRKKIDPKTVVTVQNSIPRIVIALLLVTFSYAIVGFLIDLMYVFMLLIANLLGPIAKLKDTPLEFISGNFGTAAGSFFTGGWKSFVGIFYAIPWYVHTGTMAVAGVVGLALFGLSAKTVAAAGVPHALFFLLLALTLLFGVVRLFFLLLDAYIHIIISLLTSPLHLMMEAIPGVGSFSSWMRNLISKLLVFPMVTALLLITQVITSGDTVGTMWVAPFLWNDSNASTADGLMGIIGLGMLLSIPSIIAGVQKMLKAEPVIPGGVSAITGPLGGSLGQLFNLVYQGSFIRSAFRKDHGPSPYQQAVSAGGQGLGGLIKGPGSQEH